LDARANSRASASLESPSPATVSSNAGKPANSSTSARTPFDAVILPT
jgi:hypothetical protein